MNPSHSEASSKALPVAVKMPEMNTTSDAFQAIALLRVWHPSLGLEDAEDGGDVLNNAGLRTCQWWLDSAQERTVAFRSRSPSVSYLDI